MISLFLLTAFASWSPTTTAPAMPRGSSQAERSATVAGSLYEVPLVDFHNTEIASAGELFGQCVVLHYFAANSQPGRIADYQERFKAAGLGEKSVLLVGVTDASPAEAEKLASAYGITWTWARCEKGLGKLIDPQFCNVDTGARYVDALGGVWHGPSVDLYFRAAQDAGPKLPNPAWTWSHTAAGVVQLLDKGRLESAYAAAVKLRETEPTALACIDSVVGHFMAQAFAAEQAGDCLRAWMLYARVSQALGRSIPGVDAEARRSAIDNTKSQRSILDGQLRLLELSRKYFKVPCCQAPSLRPPARAKIVEELTLLGAKHPGTVLARDAALMKTRFENGEPSCSHR